MKSSCDPRQNRNARDEKCRCASRKNMVGRILAAVEGVLARPGGAGFPGFDAADRRHCGHGSCRVHSLDGAIRNQALPRWRSGMAKAACSRSGLSPHGVFALSLFSRCSGKWSSANESRPVRAGRPNLTRDRFWKVLLHFRDACQRDSARPRRSGGSSRGRDRFSAWQKTRVAPGEVKGARARRGGSRSRSSIQYAARSEEHTSELQSPCKLVCRLLLVKKTFWHSRHAWPLHGYRCHSATDESRTTRTAIRNGSGSCDSSCPSP